MRDIHWVEHAACTEAEPDLFYPPTDGPRSHSQIRAAQRICQGCPVRRQCFEEAFTLPEREDFGIRAGTTAKERRTMRRAVPAGRRRAA